MKYNSLYVLSFSSITNQVVSNQKAIKVYNPPDYFIIQHMKQLHSVIRGLLTCHLLNNLQFSTMISPAPCFSYASFHQTLNLLGISFSLTKAIKNNQYHSCKPSWLSVQGAPYFFLFCKNNVAYKNQLPGLPQSGVGGDD